MLAQADGAFNDVSPIGLSSFSDGLSVTAIVAERSLSPLRDVEDDSGSAFDRLGWLAAGNWGDTLVTAFYPPNMYRKVAPGGSISQFFAASSLHPGGLNVLMGDGSVRFINDTVSTWPFDPSSGIPRGATPSQTGAWTNMPPLGVWQAMAGRNGGEVMSAETF